MSHEFHDTPEDPYGCRQRLREALTQSPGERAALNVLLALGQCRVFGVDPGAELPASTLRNALREMQQSSSVWIDSARTLGTKWCQTDDPKQADEQCAALLELRTELHGVELILADLNNLEDWPQELNTFDAALATELPVLSTLVGTTWLNRYRAALVEELRTAPPWWLGPALEAAAHTAETSIAATLPDAESWAVVRSVHAWKSNFPACVEPKPLAAQPEQELPPISTRAFRWRSLDERFFAHLNLPVSSNPNAEVVNRPLHVLRTSDSDPAVELAGELVVLGAFRGVLDTNGQVWLTLAELRHACDGRLFVGTMVNEWKPVIGESPCIP